MSQTASNRTPLSPTPRSTPTRYRHRARSDRAVLDAVLDAGFLCHLGVVIDGAPLVVPTIYGRDGDTLYLHGSTGSGNLRAASTGGVSVSVTHVDGIVYARAAMHLSINFRSAVIHGRPTTVTDPDEQLRAMRIVVDNVTPGAWPAVRQPTKKELAGTLVLALDLTEASVKVREGGPIDEPEDVAAGGVWAGVLPLRQLWDAPVPADDLEPGVPVPDHVLARIAGSPVAG
ncbi:pyridoxamine 5'-phosphate oxidase family protein [Nocardia otitidiscaviarum]|uniref:Pyridoxamine 5'-phosphate oxidase family protein n=1 Tax=Nocardia otitidiscaviarum TaxID=1823 RepID=A0A516NF65_9NOCA|nr:pyridoxamine 5'-phosphate oxidase family protein [Nocardia otitidiscaviarum]MBF6240137.1 pyridoxamine 5'-phosphate oxidase family protein [Nocardia otitidiscaviarum]MCP9622836.1 pyridoxamine 5'-phosphate oxidase family protein [Nocardia otitidiscaviarum]QDP77531.1 pyridoxamine 5'-phosphate oxidase family protein [Nocardia otitidiscaviarum]